MNINRKSNQGIQGRVVDLEAPFGPNFFSLVTKIGKAKHFQRLKTQSSKRTIRKKKEKRNKGTENIKFVSVFMNKEAKKSLPTSLQNSHNTPLVKDRLSSAITRKLLNQFSQMTMFLPSAIFLVECKSQNSVTLS